MAESKGIKAEQTKVGDRYVLERMREIGASPARRTVVGFSLLSAS